MKATSAMLLAALPLVVLLAESIYGYDSAAYKDPHYVDNRTTMVHLFEWKFKDIALECERFLGPMGFAAMQLSPITENVIINSPHRPWWERYQPISYKIESRSGTEAEFKDMVERCNRVGVRTFVDAVINHMTQDIDPAVGVAGSTADPKNKQYPAVPYGPDDFTGDCNITGYHDPVEVRNCRLNGLHNLVQANPHVRERIAEYLNRAIDAGIAGIRVDGAKHMWPEDLELIYEMLHDLSTKHFPPNSRPFVYQEVIDLGSGEAVSKYDYIKLGAIIEFVYGMELGTKFRGWSKLDYFKAWGFRENYMVDSSEAVVMVDNHDNQRGHGAGGKAILTHKEPRLYKMATAFMLAHPYGHPRVMSSFEFSNPDQGPPADDKDNILSPDPIEGDVAGGADANMCNNGWVCEHRWSPIYGMVEFRNVVQKDKFDNWWSNGDQQIAFSRGKRGFVAFNGQYGVDLKQELQTGLPEGEYCDVISGRKIGNKCTGKSVSVKPDGKAHIEILKDEQEGVLAIHEKSKIS